MSNVGFQKKQNPSSLAVDESSTAFLLPEFGGKSFDIAYAFVLYCQPVREGIIKKFKNCQNFLKFKNLHNF